MMIVPYSLFCRITSLVVLTAALAVRKAASGLAFKDLLSYVLAAMTSCTLDLKVGGESV